MNWPHNRVPEEVRHIHLIAVCGTAMGALAAMLRQMGYRVTGSDRNVYPPMSTFLAERGIAVAPEYSAANLAGPPDLVVIGNAISRGNPEAEAALAHGIPFVSMPQAVNHFAAAGKKPLVVTGTHGKTTTSALLAWLLTAAGRDPSFMIGGILKNFDANYRVGSGDAIVIEGDEYDTAFFDKGPKFLHYPPAAAILTSVEFDHADIYRDLDHVMSAFGGFIAGIRPERLLVAQDADANIRRLLPAARCRVQQYGFAPDSPWQLADIAIDPPWTRFSVLRDGRPWGRFKAPLAGTHNLQNALSAIAVAAEMGLDSDEAGKGLSTFAGVRRRQEVRGVKNGVTVMDDFAHHPTAVRETIRAMRPFYPDGRLIAVFEPRTNTSMRRIFQDTYPAAFDEADIVCIRAPSMIGKVPAAERLDVERLAGDIRARGRKTHLFEDTDGIIDYIRRTAGPGDLALVMSNGGFDNIHERLLEAL